MYRTSNQPKLKGRMLKRIIFAFLSSFYISSATSVFAVDAQSLNGRYNIVLFGSDYGREFTSGVGYINFDGAGNYTGMVTNVSQGQSTGEAFDIGSSTGTYSVSPAGRFTLTEYDYGYMSADGSLIVWVPIPGDIPYNESGINLGVKQGIRMGVETLSGVYNMVVFKGTHAKTFSSGIGHLNFDGAGNFTFAIDEVSHGQNTGEALGIETGDSTYIVDPNGQLVLFPGENPYIGYVSADASLIVWSTTPGNRTLQETGISIAVKQGSGMDVGSLNGEYNMLWCWSSRESGFHSGIAHINFDGAGHWSGEVVNVSSAQDTANTSTAEPIEGIYSVGPNGRLTLDNIDKGYISADGSLLIWAPVPGDISDRETGINISVKQPTSIIDLTGEYIFGSLSADADNWTPWIKTGTVIIKGDNWYQEWDDYEDHHNFSGTFATDVQPNGSININHAWGSYNAAWNRNIMLHANTAPDAKNHIGLDIIARKAVNIDTNDIPGRYAYFSHYLGQIERYGSVEWGTIELLSDSSYILNVVNEFGESQNKTGNWKLDDVNSVVALSTNQNEQTELNLLTNGMLTHFSSPTTESESDSDKIGYDLLVKASSTTITPNDIAGEYVVRSLKTTIFGQLLTCGKGNASIRADGTLSIDAFYSNGKHDSLDAVYTVNPGNKFQMTSNDNIYEGIVCTDSGIIFLSEHNVPIDPANDDWIGGTFFIRSISNITNSDGDRY